MQITAGGVVILARTLYAYRARSLNGQLIAGKISMNNQVEAVALLRRRDIFVVQIRPLGSGRSVWGWAARSVVRRIGTRHLSVFCRQFATVWEAGIPLLEALSLLAAQTESKQLRKILIDATQSVEKGKSLSEAFRMHTGVLPELFINMLAASETSGSLGQSLQRLAAHYEKEHRNREKMLSAMTYPLFIAGFSAAALTVLLVAIVPIFTDIFSQVGAALPLPTRILIAASNILKYYGPVLVLTLVILIMAGRTWLQTAGGKLIRDRLLLGLPAAGPMAKKTVVARFARTLSTLLSSGVPLLQSLETVAGVVDNLVAAREIRIIRDRVQEGGSMAAALHKSSIFPPLAVNLIAVGEKSGALDATLDKLACYYEEEVDNLIARLSSIIEPLLIAGVGIMVGFIALSIYLPLFGLSGALQGGGMP